MKTRSVERSRLVPHTVDGRTEMVLDRYTVDLPVPPRDWDRAVLTAVTAGAGAMVTASVVWSTVSIGDLLARVAVEPAAYAAAVVFDLLWIICMALEWLARYDTARAALPRRAGHAALAVAMLAVGAHGWVADQLTIGIVAAAISGLAKTGWSLVMKQHAKPLDDFTQQWVDKQRAEAGGELAMIPVRRELQRAQQLVDAEALAVAPAAAHPEAPLDEPDPEDAEGTVRPIRPSAREAVKTALSTGMDDQARVLAYVRKVADPSASEETVARYMRSFRRTA